MGGSNLYLYSHNQSFKLPNSKDLEDAGFKLKNGEEMSFFLRCSDKSGNTNEAEFEVRFCIDQTPDTTAPIVESVSMKSGSCIANGALSTNNAIFYTDEYSTCKWSDMDQSYESMPYDMIDSPTPIANGLFAHTPTLTGITLDGANYFIRCNDTSGNTMSESYKFSLRGSIGLSMRQLQPNGTDTIFGVVDPLPVELYVETSLGCDEGKSTCYYSEIHNADGNGYVQFMDTNNADGVSTQKLRLTEGEHNVFVRCIDAGGNLVEGNTTINIDIDENAPIVARVYEESGMLKLVTVRDSDCVYTFDSCDYEFDEGIEMPYSASTIHVAEWNSDKTYYIKCQDDFKGAGINCSIIVRPTEEFL